MRKTILQILVLLMAGIVIAWKEWKVSRAVEQIVIDRSLGPLDTEMVTDPSMTVQASLIWLVLITGILFLLKEWLAKFLGMIKE